jgi:hypothetical protein
MPKANSISLSHFTSAVQTAVKVAVEKHPKFKFETPHGVEFSYLIRGIPVPEQLLQHVTFGETQAFANEIAGQIGAQTGVGAEAKGAKTPGAVFSVGGHVIIGIPAVESFLMEK